MKARKHGLPVPLPSTSTMLKAMNAQALALRTAKKALARAKRDPVDTTEFEEDLLLIKRRINNIKKLLNEVD